MVSESVFLVARIFEPLNCNCPNHSEQIRCHFRCRHSSCCHDVGPNESDKIRIMTNGSFHVFYNTRYTPDHFDRNNANESSIREIYRHTKQMNSNSCQKSGSKLREQSMLGHICVYSSCLSRIYNSSMTNVCRCAL